MNQWFVMLSLGWVMARAGHSSLEIVLLIVAGHFGTAWVEAGRDDFSAVAQTAVVSAVEELSHWFWNL